MSLLRLVNNWFTLSLCSSTAVRRPSPSFGQSRVHPSFLQYPEDRDKPLLLCQKACLGTGRNPRHTQKLGVGFMLLLTLWPTQIMLPKSTSLPPVVKGSYSFLTTWLLPSHPTLLGHRGPRFPHAQNDGCPQGEEGGPRASCPNLWANISFPSRSSVDMSQLSAAVYQLREESFQHTTTWSRQTSKQTKDKMQRH